MSLSNDRLPPVFNVSQHFVEKNRASGLGAKTALYFRDETYNYEQLYRFTTKAAAFFRELGVAPEQRVAMVLPDSPELVFGFWGAVWAGCIAVPINTAYAVDDIRYIVRDCRARVLLTTTAFYEKLSSLDSDLAPEVVLVDGGPTFLSKLNSIDSEPEAATTSPDEAAFWLYTSGSTGRPKGVLHAHRSMIRCAEFYAKQTLGLRQDDICYSVARIPFAYGLGATMYMPMAVGASAVLTDAVDAFEIVADVQRHRPTVFWAIPAVYSALLAVSDISPLETSSLRLCVSAAEQLPATLWHDFKRRYDIEICEGIGTTELLHIFLSNRPGECKPGSSGRPVPGYDVRIIGADGREAPAGEIGDLEVTGETLMLGYWNRLAETRKALYGSTMRTGDKYVADEDGYYRFMGRGDDLFKINGQWVSPMEVEAVLLEHPEVMGCAVIPQRAEGPLPSIAAYIQLKSGCIPSDKVRDAIRRFAKGRLPHFRAPKIVEIVDDLPRTATGKVDRNKLRSFEPIHEEVRG